MHLSGWLYMEGTTDGIYWNSGNANGWHISPLNTTNMRMRSGNGSAVGIALNTNGSADRGFVYANNSNQCGFLNNAGNWAFMIDATRNAFAFNGLFPYTDNNMYCGSSSKRWQRVYATEFHGDGSNLTGIDAAPSISGTASGSCLLYTSPSPRDRG